MSQTIHVVRHAQGPHNLSAANHKLPDPGLTAVGEQQCTQLRNSFPNTDSIDLIVASPLKRTIYTALLSFGDIIAAKHLHVLALPDLQEVSDMPSDVGSEVAKLKREFDGEPVDFSLLEEQPDWYVKTGDREPSEVRTKAQAARVRKWLKGRKEKNIVVVTHGGIIVYLAQDFAGYEGFSWDRFWARMTKSNPPLTIDQRIEVWMTEHPGCNWANVEFRSFVFDNNSAEPTLIETAESELRRGPREVGKRYG